MDIFNIVWFMMMSGIISIFSSSLFIILLLWLIRNRNLKTSRFSFAILIYNLGILSSVLFYFLHYLFLLTCIFPLFSVTATYILWREYTHTSYKRH